MFENRSRARGNETFQPGCPAAVVRGAGEAGRFTVIGVVNLAAAQDKGDCLKCFPLISILKATCTPAQCPLGDRVAPGSFVNASGTLGFELLKCVELDMRIGNTDFKP